MAGGSAHPEAGATAPVPRPWNPSSVPPPVPAGPAPTADLVPTPPPDRRRRLQVVLGVLLALVLGLAGTTVYLYRTSHAWQDRSTQYAAASTSLGEDLAATRADLDGARAEIEAVRSQLTTAQERIVELADEKAQVGDDREAQRLLADYQARVSDAAGRVALALDQCVQGQNQLIEYMTAPETFDPTALDAYATEVAALCTAATDANDALQTELGQ